MEENLQLVAKRSITGIFTLISRTTFMQGVGFIAFIFYTILFTKEEFGVYILVSAVVDFLAYFSDVGLAGSLIQKKDQITQKDIATTFTVQQCLVVGIVIIALFGSGFVGSFYHLNTDGIYLFRALVIAFFLSSLKTIPSVLLERNLRFEKLVIPELVETIVFYPLILILAFKGFGISSFTYAVLARAIVGLIAIYIISPWWIQFAFSKESAKKLLSFGIPYQANNFIALVKDDLWLLYLGRVLPIGSIGYIGFAQKWAYVPLRIFMDNFIKVMFSSFSRLQHNAQVLGKTFEKTLLGGNLLIFPSLFGMVALAPFILQVIPKYQRWEPALLALNFFALDALLGAIMVPTTNMLSATGKINITFRFMILLTVTKWICTFFAVSWYAYNGAAAASAIENFLVVPVIIVAKRYLPFSLSSAVFLPLVSSFCMGVVVFGLSNIVTKNSLDLFVLIVVSIISYIIFLLLFGRKKLFADILLIKSIMNENT